jgi:hypothetical protein
VGVECISIQPSYPQSQPSPREGKVLKIASVASVGRISLRNLPYGNLAFGVLRYANTPLYKPRHSEALAKESSFHPRQF